MKLTMSALRFGILYSLHILSKVSCSILGETFYCSTFEPETSLCMIEGPRSHHLLLHQSKPEGPIDSEMCRGQYSLKEREMKLIKDCEFEDLLTKFGSGSIKIEKRLEEYRYTFGKTTLLDEIADRITRYERKEIGPLILSRLDPTSPPSFCDTNKYEFVSDSPLLSMNFFFDKDDKIADCSVIEGTLQLPPVGKHSKTLATSTATITTIVGNWVDRTKAFVLTQGQGSSGYAFFVQIPKTGDPGIEAVLIVHWKDMRMILRQKERRQQDATA